MASEEQQALLSPDEIAASVTDWYVRHRRRVIYGACAIAGTLSLAWLLLNRAPIPTGDGLLAVSMKGDKRLAFLRLNVSPNYLPLSYMVDPPDYFDRVPEDQKPRNHFAPPSAPAECPPEEVKSATLEQWDQYTFQTEKLMVAKGCNIYDAAIGSIALAVGGYADFAGAYYRQFLDPGATAGLRNIRGNAKCKGRETFGECDAKKDGPCGLCYGDDNATMTPPYRQAWFFRMIGDFYAYADAENVLCPAANAKTTELSNEPVRPRYWTWIDWKPVLGDNAWALLTGASHVLWQDAKGRAARIPPDAPELLLALDFVASLPAMVAGTSGGVYFCPRNTYYGVNVDVGSLVSTENNASLLAGLRALRFLLKSMKSNRFDEQVRVVERLIVGVERFLKSAYDKTKRHFRTGGRWDPKTGSISWDEQVFAVDCQSWVGSVLGARQIDSWFGGGAALHLWEQTKQVAGYQTQPNGMVKGVGYSKNDQDQVLSGEWSFGAANFLKIMASDSTYSAGTRKDLMAQADLIVTAIRQELTRPVKFYAETAEAVLYANKRYMIPIELGGWWTNPLPSRASTAWAFLWDANFNPLHLQGRFSAAYDL